MVYIAQHPLSRHGQPGRAARIASVVLFTIAATTLLALGAGFVWGLTDPVSLKLFAGSLARRALIIPLTLAAGTTLLAAWAAKSFAEPLAAKGFPRQQLIFKRAAKLGMTGGMALVTAALAGVPGGGIVLPVAMITGTVVTTGSLALWLGCVLLRGITEDNRARLELGIRPQ